MRNIGVLLEGSKSDLMSSVEGQHIMQSLCGRSEKAVNSFPPCRCDRHVRTLTLTDENVRHIFQSVSGECNIQRENEISREAWVLTGGVKIGGVRRGCRSRDSYENAGKPNKHFYQSAFELPAGRVRDSLIMREVRVFGVIDYFLAITVREQRVNLAKVSLFRPQNQMERVISLPAVKLDGIFKLEYVVADSTNIGAMKVLLTSPEDAEYLLVLDI